MRWGLLGIIPCAAQSHGQEACHATLYTAVILVVKTVLSRLAMGVRTGAPSDDTQRPARAGRSFMRLVDTDILAETACVR